MAVKPAAKKATTRRVPAKKATIASGKATPNPSTKISTTKGKPNLNGSLKKKQTTTAAVVKPPAKKEKEPIKESKAKDPPPPPQRPETSSGIFGNFFNKSSEKVKSPTKESKAQSPQKNPDTTDPLEMCRISELITSFTASPFNQWQGNSVPNIPKGLSTELMYNKLIDFPDGSSVKVHTPQVYGWVRNFANTTVAGWKQSFSLPFSGAKGSEGKSGASFAKTHDERYLIKSLTDGELRSLQELLPHLKAHYHSSGSSLVNPPVSCYTVTLPKGKCCHFVVLCNLLPRNSGVVTIFDLKGSTQGRAASEKEYQKTVPLLKDNDWLAKVRQNANSPLISAKPAVYASIMKQIDKDVAFLQKHDLMDYSLFVGQHPCFSKAVFGNSLLVKTGNSGYYLGIIDYLQKYNTSKKIAHAAKAITNDPTTLSTIPSKAYGERFKSFMKDSVFEEGSNDPSKTKPTGGFRRRSLNSSTRKPRP